MRKASSCAAISPSTAAASAPSSAARRLSDWMKSIWVRCSVRERAGLAMLLTPASPPPSRANRPPPAPIFVAWKLAGRKPLP